MSNACSKEAYNEIVRSGKLAERQSLVLSLFIDKHPEPMTATMVIENLGSGRVLSENTRNRISELVNMGFLEVIGTAKCHVTGRTIQQYKWTGRVIPKEKILSKVVCPCCHGVGEIKKEVYIDPPSGQRELFGYDTETFNDNRLQQFKDE
jgi:hypothetical protein